MGSCGTKGREPRRLPWNQLSGSRPPNTPLSAQPGGHSGARCPAFCCAAAMLSLSPPRPQLASSCVLAQRPASSLLSPWFFSTKPEALNCQGAHLASEQQEAGAAELPVHLQETLGRGARAGFVLRAQAVAQRLHLPQQHLQVGGGSVYSPSQGTRLQGSPSRKSTLRHGRWCKENAPLWPYSVSHAAGQERGRAEGKVTLPGDARVLAGR